VTHRRPHTARGEPPAPLDSATVILARDAPEGQFQVLLMRRHRAQDFMGGAYVFPGGRLDEGDCHPGLVLHARGPTPSEAKRLLQEDDLAETVALGLFFTALRETFEEAGVLLARDESGKPMDFGQGVTAGRFASYRLQLHEGRISLLGLAEKEKITYALDHLIPYAHWITPEVEARRFNTRFLLARHPAGQFPVHDTIEMTRCLWLSPASALAQHGERAILLMPPTLKTIEELNAFRTVDELFEASRSRTIHPILPQAFTFPGGFGVKLPHDPEYTIEDYKLPCRPGESSRIVLRNGGWETSRAASEAD